MSSNQAAKLIVSIAPVVCWPWRLRGQGPDQYRTAMECFSCCRDVAAPSVLVRPLCLYCGMERGLVPMIEPEDWSPKSVEAMPWLKPAVSLPLMGIIAGDTEDDTNA